MSTVHRIEDEEDYDDVAEYDDDVGEEYDDQMEFDDETMYDGDDEIYEEIEEFLDENFDDEELKEEYLEGEYDDAELSAEMENEMDSGTIEGSTNPPPSPWEPGTDSETNSELEVSSGKDGMNLNFVWLAVAAVGAIIVWKVWMCFRGKKDAVQRKTRSARSERALGDMQMVSTSDDDERDLL